MFITITGMPCSGKSTIAKIISEKYGFEIVKIGELMREEAKRRGLSILQLNKMAETEKEIDYYLDKTSAEIAKKRQGEKLIFDSRMAWHFVPQSFKVYVTASVEAVGQRLLNSDRDFIEKTGNLEYAKKAVLDRFHSENLRYLKLYGKNNEDLRNYDYVIDTTDMSAEQAAELIYQHYSKYCAES